MVEIWLNTNSCLLWLHLRVHTKAPSGTQTQQLHNDIREGGQGLDPPSNRSRDVTTKVFPALVGQTRRSCSMRDPHPPIPSIPPSQLNFDKSASNSY